jgi:hypothetical protein
LQSVRSDGRLLLYGRHASSANAALVAYDIDAGRELWSVPMDTDLALSAVGGRQLVVGSQSEIWVYAFDGTPPRLVITRPPSEYAGFQHVAVSDDGKTLALVLHESEPPGTPLPIGVSGPPARWNDTLIFIDLARGRELSRIDRTRPEFQGFDGMFGPLAWRADGTGVFMWGQTNSERPGSSVSVFLDGRVVRHNLEGAPYLGPRAQTAVEGIGSLGCMFYSGHSLTLRELDSGRDVGTVRDETRAFTGVDWSPDGREFLFESRPYPADDPGCLTGWWAGESLLFIMNATTGTTAPAMSVEDAYRRWYGGKLTWMDCDGRFVPPRPHPFGNAIAISCRNGSQEGALYVHGKQVDRGRIFRIVGVIDR